MSQPASAASSSAAGPAPDVPAVAGRRARRAVSSGTRLRVLLLVHAHLDPLRPPPAGAGAEGPLPDQAERDVLGALGQLGHDVQVLPLGSDLAAIERAAADHRPHLAFNLIEAFNNYRSFDQHVVGYLECLGLRYTGCNPRGLVLARDKALTKKILAFHRVRVPDFTVFPLGRRLRVPRQLGYPLLVKSATDDGSVGVTRASVVHDEAALRERVAAIHEQSRTDAIAEQFIEGRELYLGVLGNRVARTLPPWELDLSRLPEGTPKIVTERMKRSPAYQRKYAIDSGPAALSEGEHRQLRQLGRRVYHLLGLSGYARLDLRMTAQGEVFLIEANPNPHIGRDEDLARSAAAAGLSYPQLIDKLLRLGLSYRPYGLA
ncbi:MAG: D-alanine--D-alanine ligase [Tepidisphaerales bacterium]